MAGCAAPSRVVKVERSPIRTTIRLGAGVSDVTVRPPGQPPTVMPIRSRADRLSLAPVLVQLYDLKSPAVSTKERKRRPSKAQPKSDAEPTPAGFEGHYPPPAAKTPARRRSPSKPRTKEG